MAGNTTTTTPKLGPSGDMCLWVMDVTPLTLCV